MAKASWEASNEEVEAIVAGRHDNPFGVLGLQHIEDKWIARAFIPHAERVEAFNLAGAPLGAGVPASCGFFEGPVDITERQPVRYRASNPGRRVGCLDTITSARCWGRWTTTTSSEGSTSAALRQLGVYEMEFEGMHARTSPSGRRMPNGWSVVGPFNDWQRPAQPHAGCATTPASGRCSSRSLGTDTDLQVRRPWARTGNWCPLKADPFARQSELRPKNASVVPDPHAVSVVRRGLLKSRRERDWPAQPAVASTRSTWAPGGARRPGIS